MFTCSILSGIIKSIYVTHLLKPLLGLTRVGHIVCGFRRGTTPSGRAVWIATVRIVVRMGDYLVRDVLLLAKKLLQSDDSGQQEGEFADEQSFSYEQNEEFESQDLEHTHLHHHCHHHCSHILILSTAYNGLTNNQ